MPVVYSIPSLHEHQLTFKMFAFSSKFIVASFIFCFIAVCVAKRKEGSAEDGGQNGSSKASFLDGFKGLFEHTTPAPTGARARMLKAAHDAKASVDAAHAVIAGAIKTAKSVQSKTRDAAQRQIDGIVSNADKLAEREGGEPGCVTRLLGGSGALGLQIALNEADCPGNKVKQLENMAETVADSGQTGLTMGPDAFIKLDSCQRKGGLFVRICEAKVAATFVARASSVALRAASVAAEASSLAATIEPSLGTCASLKVAEAGAKAAQLTGKMGTCSAGAIVDTAKGAVGMAKGTVGKVGGIFGGKRRKHGEAKAKKSG